MVLHVAPVTARTYPIHMTPDEDLLIQEARRQRRNRRRGAGLIFSLAIAAVFGVLGWVVLFYLRPFVKSIPFLPLGAVTAWLLIIGIAAFVIAIGIAVAGVYFGNPRKPWGDPAVGGCPTCGNWTLRQDSVEAERPAKDKDKDAGSSRRGPRGIVTLCGTQDCGYASATVSTPTRTR